MFSKFDEYLFKEGTHTKLWKKFGAHIDDNNNVNFRVWAPNAKYVSVIGDFNNYDKNSNPLINKNGIWSGKIQAKKGDTYKYYIVGSDNKEYYKADPFGFFNEKAPKSASIIWDFEYKAKYKRVTNNIDKAINIYEVHLGSWKKGLGYKQLAIELSKYCNDMGYNYIEIMPITEYPFEGSWGYQVTGYFAPTSRYGNPDEFMEFVDILHKHNIGVILDWVPSHFAVDGHGLILFDGKPLFEYADSRGYHPEWKSHIFDYSKGEVRSFLISSANYWLSKFNLDGIRVDALASMIYLDYARDEWIANEFGGNENLDAILFLKTLNKLIHEEFDNIFMIAEDSTSYPNVTNEQGLGFDFKWNMGWMNDVLKYFKINPYFRSYHHQSISHLFYYVFNEKYISPLSHDEVVHSKGSLINKMEGNYENKFKNLKALFAFMYGFFGKKLLFMGGEFAQFKEWDYKNELDWFLLDYDKHRDFKEFIKHLNHFYLKEKSLHKDNYENFEWINYKDYTRSIFSYKRENLVVICNFADFRWENYEIELKEKYKIVFDTSNNNIIKQKNGILTLNLEPLSVVYLKK